MSRLWRGRQERIASGLPPYADAELADVTGPHDVALFPAGPAFGLAFVTVGWGGDPAQRAIFGHAGRDFGTLVRILAQERWHVVNDAAAYEAANNPAGGPVDSKSLRPARTAAAPYGGRRRRQRAAAGPARRQGADHRHLRLASRRGHRRGAHLVVRGLDGAYDVGELTGAPFLEGDARVYRIAPGTDPEVLDEGFKTIIDLAFGLDGSLYVLEHATAGVLRRSWPHRARAARWHAQRGAREPGPPDLAGGGPRWRHLRHQQGRDDVRRRVLRVEP